MTPAALPARRHLAGFSLIELMVSLAIGLVLTLAITVLLTRSESGRLGLNASNDMEQNGAFLSLQLDRNLRSAGSGFAQRWSTSYGCELRAARDGDEILPLPAALGAPFDDLPLTVRLAPAVIHAGAAGDGGDVLAIMAGAGGVGEVALSILPGSVTSSGLRLPNTLGMRGDDMVVLMDPDRGCMVQQVEDGFAGTSDQSLPLDGDYYKSSIDGLALTSYKDADGPLLLQLGNPAGASPLMVWMGVGANDTLLSYDLLRLNGSETALPLAEGVTAMHALYGVDTDDNGRLDEWHSPTEADYTADTLLDGSPASAQRLRRIVALRVGLLLSSNLIERDTVPQASSYTLFSDLDGLSVEVDLTGRADAAVQAKRRHRAFEFTVPLRNALTADPT